MRFYDEAKDGWAKEKVQILEFVGCPHFDG